MDENSNNHMEDTLEIIPLSDEEVHVFNVDEFEAGTGEYLLEETRVLKSKNNNAKNKKSKIKTKKNKTNKKKTKIKKKKVKEKQPKRNIAMILGILFLLAIGIFASWELYFSFEEVNPFDTIHIVEKGADTQAYLEIEKDELVLDEKKSVVQDLIEFAIPKNENLSMGDIREIKVVLDGPSKAILKEEKIRLNPMSMEYTIGAVSELELIDVMSSLEIDYKVEGNKVKVSNIMPRVADLNLRDLLAFDTNDKFLSPGDKYKIKLKESKVLEDYLLENGYKIDEREKEFTVEDFEFIPESLADLGNIDSMKQTAIETMELDYSSKDLEYEDFNINQVCYSSEAQNEENARDKNYGHEYTKGSLMFIIEYKEIENGEIFADLIGFTNIEMKGEVIDENIILQMDPLYENANVDMIKRDMVYNNFTCTKP